MQTGTDTTQKSLNLQAVADTCTKLHTRHTTPNRGRTAHKILDNQGDFKTAAAKSATVGQNADLALVSDRWLSRPEPIKLAIETLAKSGG
jgi:hypothetical protein